MKKILMILMTVIALGCAEERTASGELIDFIPGSTGLLLKADDPDLFFSNLTNNDFFRQNESHPFYQRLQEQLGFLQTIANAQPAYVCFSRTGNDISYLYISKGVPAYLEADSLQTAEGLTLDPEEIGTHTYNEQLTYSSMRDSVVLISNSRQLLEESLNAGNDHEFLDSPDFQKTLRAASDKHPALFVRHEQFGGILQDLFPVARFLPMQDFSTWTVLDTDINSSGLKFNGITTAEDSLKLVNLFRNVRPGRNDIAAVAPSSSSGFYSITFTQFGDLKKNLDNLHQDPTGIEPSAEKELLENSTEAGMIWPQTSSVFVIKPTDLETARMNFASDQEVTEEFRGIPIYSYEDSGNFKKLLQPLLRPENLGYFIILDRFFIFSEEPDTLKELATDFQNEDSFSQSKIYTTALENLSTEASILLVTNNRSFTKRFAENAPSEPATRAENLSFRNYPVGALQFISQDDFAHVHAVLLRNDEVSEAKGVSQTATINLDAALAAPPVFFDNHRTKTKDIAVQDIQNTLYLLSADGDIHWKKKMDSRITGRIQQVDLLRNGRFQLAFATPNALHVIDREGNDVRPFPLRFKDEITQPLSIFDYDNNRDYRFVVVQGKELFMYNNKGQRVKGFTFSKAGAEIIQPPKHIRLGNKDYILIPEASGKLNILSRTGKERVPVKEKIAFSENPWHEYNGSFVSVNAQGELVKISENGAVNRENLELAGTPRIDATPNTLVVLSENQLKIKEKILPLDYGLYTAPRIFQVSNKLYVSVTDTQARRVYLFDSNGELISGFPVYGNSPVDLDNLDRRSRPGLTVQGGENEVLLYEL